MSPSKRSLALPVAKSTLGNATRYARSDSAVEFPARLTPAEPGSLAHFHPDAEN
jgi:hypothetical protein